MEIINIRGVKASASLKLCIRDVASQTGYDIRGVKASASLKLICKRDGEFLIINIRGVKASASLKRRAARRRRVSVRRYPRCKSLGLIEATSPAWMCPARRWISEV